MNLTALKLGAKGVLSVTTHCIKDNSPKILMWVAGISELGAIGTSCYAMYKMDDILDEHKRKMDELKEMLELDKLTKDEYKKQSTKVYFDTGVKTARNWAIPVALTGVSITSALSAYKLIDKKYIAAMGSLATLTDKFGEYRSNVIEDVGPERDRVYLNNGILKAKAIRLSKNNLKSGVEQKYTDKEIDEASKVTYKEMIKGGYRLLPSNYPYEFEWSKDTVNPSYFNENSHLYNVQFVANYQVQYWNNRLIAEGIVTLNDVLKSLGLHSYMSSEFDDIGWCKSQYDERCEGFISFGFDKNETLTPERQMWLEPTPDIEQLYKQSPDSDRVMLVMNCCDIREAKKRFYGQYFGKGGKLEAIKNELC